MEQLTQIETIQFGIQSDKDIVNRSVCIIDKPSLAIEQGSVYDPRLGCVENNARCETCKETVWKCTGHFGHINLNVPIILFYKQVVGMLKIFCFNCHKLLCTKEELELQGIRGHDKIINHLANKISFCGHCDSPHPEIKYEPNENIITAVYKFKNSIETSVLKPETIKMIFDNVSDDNVSILNVNPKMFHPKHLVLTKFPVIPTCCRPRMITSDNISDDDLSISLVDIIKANNSLHKDTTNEKARSILKFKTLTYCDNSRGKAVHNTNHKPMTGIKERITKKTGHVRQNLMGKRCDKTARTVVGPDPTLKLNEVAIPEDIANMLTIPEHVTPLSYAKLTKLVNTPGKASVVIRKNGTRISVPAASIKLGTYLNHGDQIVRNGKTITVTDCKMEVKKGDVITRPSKDGKGVLKKIPTILPKKKEIVLEIGDKVERFLRDGDFVLLNRQPTLHRNSMQGMKVVVKPGKTMRVNLAIVTGFNMDFDGDEGNMFVEETIEARAELEHNSNANNHILSAQSNKPEMVIVQDSLLGAYKMTEKIQYMQKDHFMKCMMHIDHDYNYLERLAEIRSIRNEANDVYTTHALFGFIFPRNFHIDYPNLTIKYGVVTSGFFDKMSLKNSRNSLIRVLCMEYGSDITAKFIDNIQFLTNGWLEFNPFSVGIQDCLIGDLQKKKEIKDTIHKYFLEAINVSKSTDHTQIREARVNSSLNKAKDIGLKIAKEALKPNNNFISTVTSGSKGDYFNIAQITGLLGQQNLNGHRPAPTLSNKKRTLIHYPEVILDDPERQYRSRGFIASSFIEGMQPDEMFFHAMTGREGMTKTAMGTATSGYIQRSIVKINEDLKIEYDGTVRDAKKNIYQFAFGGHGFDPSLVNINENTDEITPVNIQRLAEKFNKGLAVAEDQSDVAEFLTEEEIEEIIDGCVWRSNIPKVMYEQMKRKQDKILMRELSKVKIIPEKYEEFKKYIITKYHTTKATPGECVGIIGAQSIGERQTQTTLNTFHTAGKLQQSGVGRLEEILNMSKKLKVKTCTIFFKSKYETSDALRKAISCSLVGLHFEDLYKVKPSIETTNTHISFEFNFDPKIMFMYKLNTFKIAKAIQGKEEFAKLKYTIGHTSLTLTTKSSNKDVTEVLNTLNKLLICGMEGVTAMHLDYKNGEWFVVTEGSNLKMMLAHPLIDNRRLYCNDFWEVYDCLGIIAVRRMLFNDLKKVVGGVNTLHIQLLVDKMTFRGKPCSITRYTMRNNDVGPLSKATFEESIDILLAAAMKTEVENNAGVSAAIISGNQPKAGTGFMSLMVDYKKLISEAVKPMNIIEERKENQEENQEEDAYIPEDF
jgi:DNA-directed RNA polymerase beta' subunit